MKARTLYLEKTSKIMKSNQQPNIAKSTAKLCS